MIPVFKLAQAQPRIPMKKLLCILLPLTVLTFALYIVADRLIPYTDNARVKALVIPVTPQVSGYVSAVTIGNYQPVAAGETLLKIDPEPYQIEVETKEAELELALRELGINSAEVQIAQAKMIKAQVAFDNTRLQANRIFDLRQRNLVSQSAVDDIKSELEQDESSLNSARAELLKSQKTLGEAGDNNPIVKKALFELERARLDLAWTNIEAPSRGVVVDLKVGHGTYAKKGQALINFISAEEVWIDAFFTENNLGNISLGNRVDVLLDAHPGQVFSGKVVSLNPGASVSAFSFSSSNNNNASRLPSTPRMSGWLRDPQRYPVRIMLDQYKAAHRDDEVKFRFNGQADVVVYTDEQQSVMNALGKFWITLNSYLSYAY